MRLVNPADDRAANAPQPSTLLRVVPDNAVAIGCYRASGFEPLSAEESAVSNEGQRREWYWMRLPAATGS